VADCRVAAEQRAEKPDGVVEPCRRHPGKTHQVEQGIEAAAEPEGVATSTEPVCGGSHRRGHHRMAGLGIRRGGTYPDRFADGRGCSGEHARVLGVESFGQEYRSETELFAVADLLE
jgi:hypothetical protein